MVRPPLRWRPVQRACAAPCLALCSSEVAVGFFVCIFCPEFALTAHAELFSVSQNSFVFCCPRRGVSSCKHCSTAGKGPRSQPASVEETASRPFCGHIHQDDLYFLFPRTFSGRPGSESPNLQCLQTQVTFWAGSSSLHCY